MEEFENDVNVAIEKAHRSGVSYWDIFRLLYHRGEALIMQADAEYWKNQNKGG